MIRCLLLLAIALPCACSAPRIDEPSLAPRPAEAIDPRVPVGSSESVGVADPALTATLERLVATAKGSEAEFAARAGRAEQLAASAGAAGSESWVAAQLALSRLVSQQGVATNASAEVDSIAGQQLKQQKWIASADRKAIAAAQAEIGAVTQRQAAIVSGLRERLAR